MNTESSRIFFCPMVKANAYGHHDIKVASALVKADCKILGVGLVEEGVHLRQADLLSPEILVFGFSGKDAVQEMNSRRLTPVVSGWEQLEDIRAHAQPGTKVHIKINSGMNRLGFLPTDISRLEIFFNNNKAIQIVGCCTHLMTSEDLNLSCGASAHQMQVFSEIVKRPLFAHTVLHAFNTGAAVHLQNDSALARQFPYGLRIGLGLYGYSTVATDFSRKLYPAMSFISRIVTVQKVKQGKSVSYGGTWTASRDSMIGIVPAGYADGIPTQLSNHGSVMIESQSVPIIGRVCMDYTLVDVTDIPNALNKEVEFFGTQNPADQVAGKAATITYDILTRVSERVPRIFKED